MREAQSRASCRLLKAQALGAVGKTQEPARDACDGFVFTTPIVVFHPPPWHFPSSLTRLELAPFASPRLCRCQRLLPRPSPFLKAHLRSPFSHQAVFQRLLGLSCTSGVLAMLLLLLDRTWYPRNIKKQTLEGAFGITLRKRHSKWSISQSFLSVSWFGGCVCVCVCVCMCVCVCFRCEFTMLTELALSSRAQAPPAEPSARQAHSWAPLCPLHLLPPP